MNCDHQHVVCAETHSGGRIEEKIICTQRRDGYVTITHPVPQEKRPPQQRRPSLWARLQVWWDFNIEGKP